MGVDIFVCVGESVQFFVENFIDNIEWIGDNLDDLFCMICFDFVIIFGVIMVYMVIYDVICYVDILLVIVNVFDLDVGLDIEVCIGEVFEIFVGQDFNIVIY